MPDQYYNEQTKLYEYPASDPKTGASIVLTSKTPKTAEHIAEKGYRLLTAPSPSANAPMEGAPSSSPVVEQGKAAAGLASSTILPVVGAAAGGALMPTAIGRIGGAVAGGLAGKTAMTAATEGRLPTAPEMFVETLGAASGEIANAVALKGPAEAEEIGAALRKMAKVGDPMVKIGKRRLRLTGDPVSDLNASRSIFGRDVIAAVPSMTENINRTERGLYGTMADAADAHGVRIKVPGQAQAAARQVAIDIGDPNDHPNPAAMKRLKAVAERIANFGQDTAQRSLQVDMPVGGAAAPGATSPAILAGRSTQPPASTAAVGAGRTPGAVSPGSGGSSASLAGAPRSIASLLSGKGRTPLATSAKGPTKTETITAPPTKTDLAGGKKPERTFSVRQFQKLMLDVRDLSPDFKDRLMPGSFEDGVMVSLNKSLSDELHRAVEGTPAEGPLAAANDYHQFTKVPFRDNIVKQLKGNEGRYADVMDNIVSANKPDQLRIFLKELSPELQQNMKQSWLNHNVIVKATRPDGTFDVVKAKTELDKLSPETANHIFGNEYTAVNKIMTRLQREAEAQQGILGPRSEGRAMLARVGPALASLGFYSLYKGDFPTASQALLAAGGGLGISYLLSTPAAARYFARGLELPMGSKVAIRMGSQVLSHMPPEVLQAMAQHPPEAGSVADMQQSFPGPSLGQAR